MGEAPGPARRTRRGHRRRRCTTASRTRGSAASGGPRRTRGAPGPARPGNRRPGVRGLRRTGRRRLRGRGGGASRAGTGAGGRSPRPPRGPHLVRVARGLPAPRRLASGPRVPLRARMRLLPLGRGAPPPRHVRPGGRPARRGHHREAHVLPAAGLPLRRAAQGHPPVAGQQPAVDAHAEGRDADGPHAGAAVSALAAAHHVAGEHPQLAPVVRGTAGGRARRREGDGGFTRRGAQRVGQFRAVVPDPAARVPRDQGPVDAGRIVAAPLHRAPHHAQRTRGPRVLPRRKIPGARMARDTGAAVQARRPRAAATPTPAGEEARDPPRSASEADAGRAPQPRGGGDGPGARDEAGQDAAPPPPAFPPTDLRTFPTHLPEMEPLLRPPRTLTDGKADLSGGGRTPPSESSTPADPPPPAQ